MMNGDYMKKKIVMICILLIPMVLLGYVIYEHHETKDGISVIGYHGVVSDEEKKNEYAHNRYYLSETQFRRHIQYLYDHHYETLSMEEVEEYYQGKRDVSQNAVALTFDDGYKNFNTIVKPILEEYQMKGTCFVIGKHINDDKEKFLKQDDIINGENISYYSHSYDLHRKAPGFDKKIIETLSLEEINQDFQKNPVDASYFAFPYGRSVKGVKDVLKANQVHLAFSYNQMRHMTRNDNAYQLPRYMIVDLMPDFYIHWIVE